MFRSIALLCLFVGQLILCATLPTWDGRVVGGETVNITQYPYQISLTFNSSHTCGGFIIDKDTIGTAAHCVGSNPPSQFAVRAGSSSRLSGGQYIKVAKIIVHEYYEWRSLENDITLLKLESSLQFNEAVQPIQLPSQDSDVLAGQSATVTGWGVLEWGGGVFPTFLQRGVVPVISREVCDYNYFFWGGVTERQICAGDDGIGTCQGDSGGPLVVNNQVVGIVSRGYQCALETYPTIFTRVSMYVNWISANK